MRNYDINRDGKVTERDINQASEILEIELREEKAETQKKMAWVAMFSMLVFTLFLFTPYVSDGRVSALGNLLGLFYIAQAGVVGAYMGVTAWMSNSGSSRSYSNYTSTKSVIKDEEETPIKGRD